MISTPICYGPAFGRVLGVGNGGRLTGYSSFLFFFFFSIFFCLSGVLVKRLERLFVPCMKESVSSNLTVGKTQELFF